MLLFSVFFLFGIPFFSLGFIRFAMSVRDDILGLVLALLYRYLRFWVELGQRLLVNADVYVAVVEDGI